MQSNKLSISLYVVFTIAAVYAENLVRFDLVKESREQVHGCNLRQMVAQEGAPALTTRTAVCAGHVLGHGRLRNRKAELEQLAMNARRTPKHILNAHSTDQRP